MIRNPFARDDYGCSFVCFIGLFAIVQVLFYLYFMKPAYFTEYREHLIELANEEGFKYNAESQKWSPELDESSPFLQTEDFIDSSGLMIPAIVFYTFALLWLISYLRLICTDVKSTNYVTAQLRDEMSNASNQKRFLICEMCQVVRRRDIVHCNYCNVCSEFHDHHCGVFQVCIAGKTYKFFILVIVHAMTQLLSIAGALVVIDNKWRNDKLRNAFGGKTTMVMVPVVGIISFSMICIMCCFFTETPCFSGDADSSIMD